MITFLWPYAFILLILPFIVYLSLKEIKKSSFTFLKVQDLKDFLMFKENRFLSSNLIKICLLSFSFLSLVIGAARPQILKEAIPVKKEGRDLMLAVDLSESMLIRDFEVKGKFIDRLSLLKMVAKDFIDQRKGDRIGLILFGTNAYIQTPLTYDHETVKQLLLESEVGLAGGNTAIGDAIALAVKQLKSSKEKSRVLILLTDGNNNSGALSPEKATELAANIHLKIHTVAIGPKVENKRFLGHVEIDEKALKAISDKTGGKYYRAYNSQELGKIYDEINQLEAVEQDELYFYPKEEVYYIPVLLAILGLSLVMLLNFQRKNKIS